MTTSLPRQTLDESPVEDSGPVLSVRDLHKQFHRKNGDVVRAIDDVTLDVAQGEFLVLLGPSGCGKTTLLRSIAGLERPDSGTIAVQGKTVYDAAVRKNLMPEHRDLGMIFQSYALWPHMSVSNNVAYPLQARSKSLGKAAIKEKVHRILGLMGLEHLADQFPSQLSGGQQQRVALARALVGGRRLILFDEPLSNVDAKVRETLRRELKAMQAELGFSGVYVTHDQTEAMELADRIAVIHNGKVEQLATPEELYYRPVSRYVADFIGAANLVDAKVVSVDSHDTVTLESPFGRIVAPGSGFAVGQDVVAMVRPERCFVSVEEPSGPNVWKVELGRRVFYGSHLEVDVKLPGAQARSWVADRAIGRNVTDAWMAVEPEDVRVMAY